MPDYHIPLYPNCIYHVFSRAVGNEKLFRTKENYFYFLLLFQKHVGPVANVFSYSLMPNLFHFLLQIKSHEEIGAHFFNIKKKEFTAEQHNISDFIMERFSNLLNAYTKAFNKQNQRRGALFIDYLKRTEVQKNIDFGTFVFYIHKNALHHGLTKMMGEWAFDSYQAMLSSKNTNLLRTVVLEWFGGRDAFVEFHNQIVEIKKVNFFE